MGGGKTKCLRRDFTHHKERPFNVVYLYVDFTNAVSSNSWLQTRGDQRSSYNWLSLDVIQLKVGKKSSNNEIHVKCIENTGPIYYRHTKLLLKFHGMASELNINKQLKQWFGKDFWNYFTSLEDSTSKSLKHNYWILKHKRLQWRSLWIRWSYSKTLQYQNMLR